MCSDRPRLKYWCILTLQINMINSLDKREITYLKKMSLSIYTVQINLINKMVIYFMIKVRFQIRKNNKYRTRITIRINKNSTTENVYNIV